MAKKGQYKKGAKAESVQKRAYQASPEQKKNRAARNKARRQAIKEGRVRKGDGKDIDHKRPLINGGSTAKSNTRVVSRSKNRSSGGAIGGRRSHGGGRPKGSRNK